MLAEVLLPGLILGLSVWALFLTIIKFVLSGRIRDLFSSAEFNETWFGILWTYVGPRSKRAGQPTVEPLLEGRLTNGRVHDKVAAQPLYGTVLEIGAGSGMWTDVYKKIADDAKRDAKQGPTKIYGVEPNHLSAATLRQRVKDIGLSDIYEVVPVPIQDLNNATAWGGAIAPGSVDCIVTVQCLCSIPDPEKNAELLHKYLKKGGTWYVYEHVRADRGVFVIAIQRLIDAFLWKYMLGGCRLCRNTEKTLSEITMWEKIDLAQPCEESSWALVPHVVGTLTK